MKITDDPILFGIIISGAIVLFIAIIMILWPNCFNETSNMDWLKSSNFSCNMGCYRMAMEIIPGFNDSNAGKEQFAVCSNYCLQTYGDGENE